LIKNSLTNNLLEVIDVWERVINLIESEQIEY
jgi:hypothetical protein